MSQDVAKRPYHALSVIPDIDQKLLQAISTGKSLKSVADEYGVSDVAVLNRVTEYPEYSIASKVGARLRMDMREAELEGADNNVSVTRADRLLGHSRWVLERLDSRYNLKQQVEHSGHISGPSFQVVINATDAAQQIEHNQEITDIDQS